MSADTRKSQIKPWTGPANTWDPAHMDRHLRPGEPDVALYPVHPRGTWRRAMLLMSQGYRPEPEDMADLARWSRLKTAERKAELARYSSMLRAVSVAAAEVLEDGEVLGARNLARRVAADYPDLPGYHTVEDHLRAVPPIDLDTHHSQGGSHAGARYLYRVYLPKAGGSPGHFFATSRVSLRRFWEERRVHLAQRAERAWQSRTDNETERMTA